MSAPRKSLVLRSLIFILALPAIITLLYFLGLIRFNYPTLEKYPVWGIDISHHQGKMDWPLIDQNKFKFVFIKATEGGDLKDQNFVENWAGAQKVGLLRGAYHFFTLCKDGKTQAQNFIDTVPVVDDALSPVVDLEFVGNCQKRPSREEFDSELFKFLLALENHYGRQPIFYTTHEFVIAYLTNQRFDKYPLWIRDTFREPALVNYRTWDFWQFADRVKIDGIDSFVDLNVFRGSSDELKKRFVKNVQ